MISLFEIRNIDGGLFSTACGGIMFHHIWRALEVVFRTRGGPSPPSGNGSRLLLPSAPVVASPAGRGSGAQLGVTGATAAAADATALASLLPRLVPELPEGVGQEGIHVRVDLATEFLGGVARTATEATMKAVSGALGHFREFARRGVVAVVVQRHPMRQSLGRSFLGVTIPSM